MVLFDVHKPVCKVITIIIGKTLSSSPAKTHLALGFVACLKRVELKLKILSSESKPQEANT